MHATVGDRLVIHANRVDAPDRDGEILEVRHADGVAVPRARSDTGHEALVFPGPDATVQNFAQKATRGTRH